MVQGKYTASCTDCELKESDDDYDAVAVFKKKHEKHTGHQVEWEHLDDPDFDDIEFTEFLLDCPDCGRLNESFMLEENAEDYAKEHEAYSTHDRPQITEKTFEPSGRFNGVKSIIAALEKEFNQRMVPAEKVIAYGNAAGMPAPAVQQELENMKEMGEIYEPKKEYLTSV